VSYDVVHPADLANGAAVPCGQAGRPRVALCATSVSLLALGSAFGSHAKREPQAKALSWSHMEGPGAAPLSLGVAVEPCGV